MEPLQLGAHIHAELGVQIGQGLVQQKQSGLGNNGAGDGHTLLLAAGQLGGIAFGKLTDLHTVQSAGDLFGDGLVVFLADTQAEGHVVEHGHVGPQRVGLEHQIQVALAGRGERSFRRVDDLLAVHQDDAALGLFQTGDHAEGGGLAAAGGPQQGHEVAVLDGEVQILQNVVFAVIFINMSQFNFTHGLVSSFLSHLSRPCSWPGLRLRRYLPVRIPGTRWRTSRWPRS